MTSIVKRVWRKWGYARLRSVCVRLRVGFCEGAGLFDIFPDNAGTVVLENNKTCIIVTLPYNLKRADRYKFAQFPPIPFCNRMDTSDCIALRTTTTPTVRRLYRPLHFSHCRVCHTRTEWLTFVMWLDCDCTWSAVQGVDGQKSCICLCCRVFKHFIYTYATELEICKYVSHTHTHTHTHTHRFWERRDHFLAR